MPINRAPSANAAGSPHAPAGQHLEAAAEAADQDPCQGSALIRIRSPRPVFCGRGWDRERVRASGRGRGRGILLSRAEAGVVEESGAEEEEGVAGEGAHRVPISVYLFVTRIPSVIFSTC